MSDYSKGLFENPELKELFESARKTAMLRLHHSADNWRQDKRIIDKTGPHGVFAELLNMTVHPFNNNPREIARGAGRMAGMWNFLNETDLNLKSTLMHDALCKTLDAIQRVTEMPCEARTQYYLNALPLWRDAATFQNKFSSAIYHDSVITLAIKLGETIPNEEIDAAVKTFDWNRGGGEIVRLPVAARPDAPHPKGELGLVADMARDQTVRDLDAISNTGTLIEAVKTAPTLDYLEDGKVSYHKLAQAAGTLNGLWAFYDAHNGDEKAVAIIPALVEKTKQTFEVIRPAKDTQAIFGVYIALVHLPRLDAFATEASNAAHAAGGSAPIDFEAVRRKITRKPGGPSTPAAT